MRYRLVEKQTTYRDTPHNNSWMGSLNFHVEDEDGKIVGKYSADFNYWNDFTYCYEEAGEGYCLNIYVNDWNKWADVVLDALNKWQPLDYDYNFFYENSSYFGKPIFKNKSPRECAELILRQKEQEIEQLRAQKKQQIAQRKIEAARWQAEREEVKKLKEQEEAARLERIKQEEAVRLERERINKEKRRIIGILLICIMCILIFYISSLFFIANAAGNLVNIFPYIKNIVIYLICIILFIIFTTLLN